MTPCEITQDLLPLYIDNSCTEDSRAFVEEHLASCESCRTLYETMNKSVQIITTRQNAKKSYASFQKRIRTQRILIIALVALIVIAPIAYFIYDEYSFRQYWPQPARIEPIASSISRLSDGSIYLTLQYTDDDAFVNHFQTSRWHMSNPFLDTDIYFEDEDTLYIQPGYSLFQQKDKRMLSNNYPREFIITTDESYDKYMHYNQQGDEQSHPYTRIVLLGSDGERVLWQKGDYLPAAESAGEEALSKFIRQFKYINSLSTPEP